MRKYGDPFKLATEKVKVVDCGAKEFVIRSILHARNSDIIHIHGAIRVFPILRRIFPNKKIIMHYHGTKIRGKWDQNKWISEKADMLLVSTPDLLEGSPEKTIYLPNIVDQQLIYHISGGISQRYNKAFHCRRYALDIALEYADLFNLEIDVFDRDQNPLSHFDFLRKMSRYEFVIDVKREYPSSDITFDETKIARIKGKRLDALSLTGLEALALGCKVIRYDGELLSEFPQNHDVRFVCDKLDRIYRECL
jgi:hypothetical protein